MSGSEYPTMFLSIYNDPDLLFDANHGKPVVREGSKIETLDPNNTEMILVSHRMENNHPIIQHLKQRNIEYRKLEEQDIPLVKNHPHYVFEEGVHDKLVDAFETNVSLENVRFIGYGFKSYTLRTAYAISHDRTITLDPPLESRPMNYMFDGEGRLITDYKPEPFFEPVNIENIITSPFPYLYKVNGNMGYLENNVESIRVEGYEGPLYLCGEGVCVDVRDTKTRNTLSDMTKSTFTNAFPLSRVIGPVLVGNFERGRSYNVVMRKYNFLQWKNDENPKLLYREMF